MKVLAKVLLMAALSIGVNLAMGLPADDDATAAVTCTVDGIMEWDVVAGNFATIAIAPITAQGDTPSAGQSLVLYTNGNAHITADTSTAAQLTKTTDTLVTEYKLEYDGDGVTATGGSTVNWTLYNNFLTAPSAITHISLDGAVNVTLSARASNDAGNIADAGDYTATQTLTASWGDP